eukprot:gene8918-biopygen10493
MTPRVDVLAEGLELLCVEISPPKSKPFLVVAWYRPTSDPVGRYLAEPIQSAANPVLTVSDDWYNGLDLGKLVGLRSGGGGKGGE